MRVNVMHVSMQYSDTAAQQATDAQAVFSRAKGRGVWWITGTEANDPGDRAVFAGGATQNGYRFFHHGGDVWIAVDPACTTNNQFNSDFTLVIHGKAGSYPNRGVLRVSFNTELGLVTVLACHYNLSGPRHPHAPGAEQNPMLAREIARQARRYGKGSGLCFYGGDQNLHDERGVDTFYGKPLTSVWDELKHYEPTHPGRETIDVIASYDKDRRVKAAYAHALDDTKLKLHTDHYPVEAGFDIDPLPTR